MVIEENKKNILDLGCGQRKVRGAIGIDFNSNTDADVIHDLTQFPYPFENNYFEEIYCNHILEHLPDLVKVMEELHRVAKPKCKIFIAVPYWTSYRAFVDPTHVRFFTEKTFDYFTEESKMNFYSKARFKVVDKKLELSSKKLVRMLGIFLPVTFFKMFNNLISNVYFELEVVK